MKILLKIFAAPLALSLTIIVAFCGFILSVTGVIFWLLSVLVFVGAVLLFFSQQAAGGIAFLISPYGLPALAAWVVGKLDGVKFALREFIMG